MNNSRHLAKRFGLIWLVQVRAMYPLDPISAIRFGEGELRIDFGGGEADRYRIKDGKLEFFTCRSRKAAWYALSPEEILQHVVLHTPVASWLYVRLRLNPASEIASIFDDTRGATMVTDPVCGREIEEIDVPESLQSKYEGKVYYFCSYECKSEFDRNRQSFVHAA